MGSPLPVGPLPPEWRSFEKRFRFACKQSYDQEKNAEAGPSGSFGSDPDESTNPDPSELRCLYQRHAAPSALVLFPGGRRSPVTGGGCALGVGPGWT